MSESMIERAAEVLWQRYLKRTGATSPKPLSEMTPATQTMYHQEARAVFAAARIATDKMNEVGHQKMPVEYRHWVDGEGHHAKMLMPQECVQASTVWAAMIDAILAEKP